MPPLLRHYQRHYFDCRHIDDIAIELILPLIFFAILIFITPLFSLSYFAISPLAADDRQR
jgi:hypothetical protein